MSPPDSTLPKSRLTKTMQFEPIPPGVIEALETEAWFRRHLVDPALPASRQPKRLMLLTNKEAVFEEALRWFVTEYAQKPPAALVDVQSNWERSAFWLTNGLLERCRALAQKWDVSKRQIFATALSLYVRERVPPELLQFRQKTFAQARELYNKHRAEKPKSARRARRS